MKTPDPALYLLHMRDACVELDQWRELRDTPAVPPRILFFAVCRALEIIGEASRKVGPEFRAAHPDLPWRLVNDLRDVIIHDYDMTDEGTIWEIVERDVPPLLKGVRRVLAELGDTR